MTKGQNILAAIVILGFAVITAIAFLSNLMADLRGEIAMAWIVNFTTVIGYKFGSSQASDDKDKLLAEKKPPEV